MKPTETTKIVGPRTEAPPVTGLQTAAPLVIGSPASSAVSSEPSVTSQAASVASSTRASPEPLATAAVSREPDPQHLIWALDQTQGDEHVTLQNFVNQFGFTDQAIAHSVYKKVIRNSGIHLERREKLAAAFKVFKREGRAKEFWNALKNPSQNVQSSEESHAESSLSREKRKRLIVEEQEEEESTTVDEDTLEEIQDSIPYFRDPFKPLIDYILKKVRGEAANLPQVPALISENHRQMFEWALDAIKVDNPAVPQKGRKKNEFELRKDVLVILSGIINTISPAMRDLSLSDTIEGNSALPTFKTEAYQEAVKGILSDMLHALCPGIESDTLAVPHLKGLQKWVRVQLAKIDETPAAFRETREKVLEVVSYLCTVITSKGLALPNTEYVFVSVWSHVLNLLFDSNLVRAIPGELGSAASESAKLATEKEHGVTTRYVGGKEVDISIRIEQNSDWDTEIAVFEFKPDGVEESICNRQQRKSVRLNTAILLELEKRGLDATKYFPVIAEGKWRAVNFYTLCRYGDVHGAGRTTAESALLPESDYSMKTWLKSDSLHLILALVDRTHLFARAVKEAMSSNVAGPYQPRTSSSRDLPPPI
ncbi:MAG: hypothetical protein J3Q66DRAFT_359296 [Benniella sp.]|nr:MAG: hypothetical protein J3Q66DRAFT_359296 [Benniella sp.]